MLTGDEANDLAVARALRNTRKMVALAVLVVFALVVFSFFLQREQERMDDYAYKMCKQKYANDVQTNRNWEDLAIIERRNEFIDEDIRQARLRVFDNAKLTLPDCEHK